MNVTLKAGRIETTYADFVGKLVKPMPPLDALMHMAAGLAGESGEVIDCVKKAWAYGKPLDVVNLREEAGDILFYLQGLCLEMGWSLEQIAQDNTDKLQARYPSGAYSNEQAIARADKAVAP